MFRQNILVADIRFSTQEHKEQKTLEVNQRELFRN